jgi:hypothetical protein
MCINGACRRQEHHVHPSPFLFCLPRSSCKRYWPRKLSTAEYFSPPSTIPRTTGSPGIWVRFVKLSNRRKTLGNPGPEYKSAAVSRNEPDLMLTLSPPTACRREMPSQTALLPLRHQRIPTPLEQALRAELLACDPRGRSSPVRGSLENASRLSAPRAACHTVAASSGVR